MDNARKANRSLLFAHEKSLNFKAKSSKGVTKSNENTIVIPVNIGLVNTNALTDSGKKTNEVRNIAFAGVGNPINESVCLVSTLNLAKRNADKTAIMRAMYASQLMSEEESIQRYMTNAGNTPKLTMSASESSSLPIDDDTFKSLAVNPSKKSNTQAAQIK